MATYYVSKSGNDSNSGASYALSKLTIQAALSLGSNTVIVGSGLYNEKLTIAGNTILYADGVVTVDGTNLVSNPLLAINAAGSYTLTVAPYTSGGQWIFQNNIGTYLVYLYTGVNGGNYQFTNCIFLPNGNSYGLYHTSGYAEQITLNNCLFTGFTTAGFATSSIGNGRIDTIGVYNSTFYNCGVGIYGTQSSGGITNLTASLNIFSNCTTAYQTATAVTYSNDNQFYTVTNFGIVGANTYTSLATLQAAGYDSRSIEANPNFADPTNKVFFLTSASPVSNFIGMYPFGKTNGSTDHATTWDLYTSSPDNSKWYNPDGNLARDGSTYFFYLSSGTTGVAWSPVYDAGSTVQCNQVNLEGIFSYPTSLIDYDISDVRPNYQTCEIRASNTTFNQDDGVISWTVVKNNISFNPITGRYFQIRLTFRSNDVAA